MGDVHLIRAYTWDELWVRLTALEAVADAARAVLAAGKLDVADPDIEQIAMGWNRVSTAMLGLADDLDALDALDKEAE